MKISFITKTRLLTFRLHGLGKLKWEDGHENLLEKLHSECVFGNEISKKSCQPNYMDERKMGVTSAGEFEIDHSLFIDNALLISSSV